MRSHGSDRARAAPISQRAPSAVLILFWMAVTLFPMLWVAFGAFRTPADLTNPGSLATHPTWDNFTQVASAGIVGSTARSTILGIGVAAVGTVVGSLAAYSVARYRTGGEGLRVGVLLPTLIPPTVLAFPILALALRLRINDSLWAVGAAHLTYVVPLVTWFLVGFFKAVPRELEEQASIDGFGPWQAFLRVVVPTVYPGLAAAFLLGFMLSWNEFFFAVMLAPGDAKTLPVAIAGFNTFQGVSLGPLSAAVLISVIPVTVLSFVIQRYFVKSLGGSGVKQ